MAVKYNRSPAASVPAINNELQKIQAALEDAVSRTGAAPNQLEATLDANSQRIINLPEPVTNTEPVRKEDFDELGNKLRSDVYTAVRDAEDATNDAISAANSANAAAGNANTAASNAYQAITDLESDGYAVINQIESDGKMALDALRVVNAGSFDDGATLTARNEVLYYLAEQTYYRWDGALPKTVPPASTPASTGGVGAGAWVDVGDTVLRSELANPDKGAAMVARGVVAVDSIADLLALPEGQRKDGLRYLVKGYHAGTDVGGGEFYFDPDRVAENDGGVLLNGFVRVASSYVTPYMYGARGDGISDDTAHINACLANNRFVYIPDGEYMINAVDPDYDSGSHYKGGVRFQTNNFVMASKGASFRVIPNARQAYVCANLYDVEDVYVLGLKVIGDVRSHVGVGGEWGHGFFIHGASKNVHLADCEARECWGDGFIVGGLEPVIGGSLSDCRGLRNRRQGLSIVNWDGGKVFGGDYSETGYYEYTPPACGIDIEPNPKSHCRISVSLYSPTCSNNGSEGILFQPGYMTTAINPDAEYNVVCYSPMLYNNGFASQRSRRGHGMRFSQPVEDGNNTIYANKVSGSISVYSPVIKGSAGNGIRITRWASSAPDVYIHRPHIENACSGDVHLSGAYDRSAICHEIIGQSSIQAVGTGKVLIDGPRIADTRVVTTLEHLIFVTGLSASNRIGDCKIKEIEVSGSAAQPSGGDAYLDNTDGLEISWSKSKRKVLNGNLVYRLGALWGATVTPDEGGSTRTIFLKEAYRNVGEVIRFTTAGTGNSLIIQPDQGEPVSLAGYVDGPGGAERSITIQGEGDLTLMSNGAGWDVLDYSPVGVSTYGASQSDAGHLRPAYTDGMPTAGAWKTGSILYERVPQPGEQIGWVCVAGGAPGTWKPFGVIGE